MAYDYPQTGPTANSEEYRHLYTISLDQSSYSSTASSNASGGITGRNYKDFGGAFPSTLANAERLARGGLRWQKLMQILGTYSNFTLLDINYTEADANTQITALSFSIVVDNVNAFPLVGNDIGGNAITTVPLAIRNLIGKVLTSSFTENCEVYNPSGDFINESLTASAVNATVATVLGSITVARDTAFDKFLDSELPSGGIDITPTNA